MSWRQLSLSCPAAQLAEVEDLMMELGALSISLSDAGDDPIYEPLPGDAPIWQESIVSATFAEDSDPERTEYSPPHDPDEGSKDASCRQPSMITLV